MQNDYNMKRTTATSSWANPSLCRYGIDVGGEIDTTRSEMDPVHGTPAYEDSTVIIWEDSAGYEYQEFADSIGVSWFDFYQHMHKVAKRHLPGGRFEATYPLVVYKPGGDA